MRRKDREVSDIKEINNFLIEQKIIRIGFSHEGEVYIVPVNYGFEWTGEKFVFYFHGAKAGRKYELASERPCVGFEIDGEYQLMTGDTACEHSAHYKSVIGSGRLTLIEDNTDKIYALGRIMKQATGTEQHTFNEKMVDAVAVFRLEAEKITCKAR